MKKITCFVLTLVAGLSAGTMSVSAQTQTVTMNTSRDKGATLSLKVNDDATFTVNWGGGQEVEATPVDGVLSGTIQGQTVVLKVNGLTSLDCSNQEITSLSFVGTGALKSLDCSDNQIKMLTLPASVETVDCSNNLIASLTLTSATRLRTLDCSFNKLTTLNLKGLTNLRQLYCNDNELARFLTPTDAKALETIWMENNQLTTLRMTSWTNLQSFYAVDNSLNSLTQAAASNARLVDFWVDNNALTTIDMTGAGGLQTFSVADNELSSIKLAEVDERLLYANFNGNPLSFSSLYSNMSVTSSGLYYDQLKPFALTDENGKRVEAVLVNSTVYMPARSAFGDGTSTQSVGVAVYSVGENGEDTPLVKGTDYTTTGDAITFLKNYAKVYVTQTGNRGSSKGVKLTSEVIKVGLPTGIDAPDAQCGFTWSVEGNTLCMVADEATEVTVATLAGQLVWKGTVSAAGTRVALQANAVYVVNGQKIAL